MEKEKNYIPKRNLNKIFNAKLSDKDFDKLSRFIHRYYGIKMPKVKKIMLQSRLQKRLRALEMDSYEEYVKYVFGKNGQDEIIHMMDVVSTNKTDFFREPVHFEFMRNVLLPEFLANGRGKKLQVWSAGCSTGEEPYTIAMVLNEFTNGGKLFDYSIYCTDLSTKVLKEAKTAIYSEDKVNVIPLALKKKYLLKSKNSEKKLVRVIPELRAKCHFDRLNFMDKEYKVNQQFDIIFCRNVLIYFDRETQEQVINNLCKHLKPGGCFFFGHSESITGIDVPLKHVQPTIFKRIIKEK